MLWELLTKQQYLEGAMWRLEESVLRGVRPPVPAETNDSYARLIDDAWAQLPERRPSAAAVLERVHGVQRQLGLPARATMLAAEVTKL